MENDSEYDIEIDDYYNEYFHKGGYETTETGNFCSNYLHKCWVDFPTQLFLILTGQISGSFRVKSRL